MSGNLHELLFGVAVIDGDYQARSRHWRVRSAAKQPEVFVEQEGLARVAHLSLHASGAWHLVVGKRWVHEWSRPEALVPGYVRALAIVQPPSVTVLQTLSDDPAAQFWATGRDADPAVFNVFLEEPGVDVTSWPYRRSQGAELGGRLPLAGGAGTCRVVAYRVPIAPFDADLADDSERFDEFAGSGRGMSTIVGRLEDGTVALFDGVART